MDLRKSKPGSLIRTSKDIMSSKSQGSTDDNILSSDRVRDASVKPQTSAHFKPIVKRAIVSFSSTLSRGLSSKDKSQNGIKSDSRKSISGNIHSFYYPELTCPSIKSSEGYLFNKTHIRAASINLPKYCGPMSKTFWFTDAFTLTHNAVRRICLDLYDILISFAGMSVPLTSGDMEMFEKWWKISYDFLKHFFEAETTIIFPWVEKAEASKTCDVPRAMGKVWALQLAVESAFQSVSDAFAKIGCDDENNVYTEIYVTTDIFLPLLIDYLEDQEKLLPAIIRSVFHLKDRVKVDKVLVEHFLGGPLTKETRDLPHHNMILLVRWITNPQQLSSWLTKNLAPKAQSRYAHWFNLYDLEHASYVRYFRERANILQSSPHSISGLKLSVPTTNVSTLLQETSPENALNPLAGISNDLEEQAEEQSNPNKNSKPAYKQGIQLLEPVVQEFHFS